MVQAVYSMYLDFLMGDKHCAGWLYMGNKHGVECLYDDIAFINQGFGSKGVEISQEYIGIC